MPQLPAVEILSTGTWYASNGNPVEITEAMLDGLVRNFERFGAKLKPFVKLGHTDKQVLAQKDGQPALGWVSRVYRQGRKLVADFVDVPQRLMEAIRAGRYRRVSSEFFTQLEKTTLADTLGAPDVNGPALLAVAFLGAELPAITDLEDLPRLLAGDGVGETIMLAAPPVAGATAVSADDLIRYVTVRVPLDADGALTLDAGVVPPIHAPSFSHGEERKGAEMADTKTDMQPMGPTREEMAAQIDAAVTAAVTKIDAQHKAEMAAKDAEKEAAVVALKAQLDAVTAQQREASARALHVEAERFADGLMTPANPRITQAMRPYVVALFKAAAADVVALSATDAAKALCFAAGETPADLSVKDCVLRLMAALPALPIGERTTTPKAQDGPVDAPQDWDGAVRLVAKEQSIDLTQPGAYKRAADIAFKDERWAKQAKSYGRSPNGQ